MAGKPPRSPFGDHAPLRSFYEHSRVIPKYSTAENDPRTNAWVAGENLFIDYESRTYVRMMKRMETPQMDNGWFDTPHEKKLWNKAHQHTFFLRFYLPKRTIGQKSSHHRIKHLVVMFNGLNETDRYDFYDVIGGQLADSGIAAVLLPTPYQLNRRTIDRGTGLPVRPTDIASKKGNGILFYYNFKRSLCELDSLVHRLTHYNARDHGFYETYFAPDPEISLLGFSMGGVRALGAFLVDQMKHKNRQKFHSCITFNSDCNVFEADLQKLFKGTVDPKDMTQIKQEVFSSFQGPQKIAFNRRSKAALDVFKTLYLTKGKDDNVTRYGRALSKPEMKGLMQVRQAAERSAARLLLIQSGADEAFRSKAFEVIEPPDGFHRLFVGGVKHIVTMDKKWDHWLSNVGQTMVRFIGNVREVDYTHYDMISLVRELIKDTPSYITWQQEIHKEHSKIAAIRSPLKRKKALEAYRKDFECGDFTLADLLKLSNEVGNARTPQDVKVFMEMYYVSKGFYPRFCELLSKIMGVGRLSAALRNTSSH